MLFFFPVEFVLFRCNILSFQHHVKLKDEPTYTLFIKNIKENYRMIPTCVFFWKYFCIFPWSCMYFKYYLQIRQMHTQSYSTKKDSWAATKSGFLHSKSIKLRYKKLTGAEHASELIFKHTLPSTEVVRLFFTFIWKIPSAFSD